MVRVVTSHMAPVDSVRFGGTAQVKRKTPSQLREEQLRRKKFNEVVDESVAPLTDSNKGMAGFRKPDWPKNPTYIETRLGDVYKVKKSRLQLLSGKENAKKQEIPPVEKYRSMKHPLPILSNVTNEQTTACIQQSLRSSEATKDDSVKCSAAVDKCSEHTFRSVAELSLGNERLSDQTEVDMDKALRGLAASKPSAFLSVTSSSSECRDNSVRMTSVNICPKLTVPGRMTPLDLSLKTYMRVVSASSVSWFHRSITGSTCYGMPQSFMQNKEVVNQEINLMADASSDCRILKSKALYSWVYPQSSLPSSVIKALTLSSAEGDEMYFLRKRYSAWEDAFRCLYFMLRKNACTLFYVCTAQFAVMFTSSSAQGNAKSSCKAYISRSTRGLRALLKENDVCFSMPLSPARMEEATMDDLLELSEIEKQNLGQTRRPRSFADIDGNPKSLLAFDGNQNVHGLYDFLLNHKSLLSTQTGADVPVLYSPVMFQNASLHTPEFQCQELRKLDHSAPLEVYNKQNREGQDILSGAVSYSIEVRDKYIPPWITCNLCAIMGSRGGDFEGSFTTEPTSAGLNFALEALAEKSAEDENKEGVKDGMSTFGITDAFVASELCSAVLKSLKYCNNTISASLSRI